jgi:hypothetical protein
MSDLSSNDTPRPVSLVTVFAIFVLFGAFLLVARYVYLPKQTGAFAGDGIHTQAQREENLKVLREKQNAQATKYGWVDQKAGVVQLPIERSMELTVQKYGTKK